MMEKQHVSCELRKLLKDEDLVDTGDRLILLRAAQLLETSVFTLLSKAYKAGCLDGLNKVGYGTNKHIVARQMGDAYALAVLRGDQQFNNMLD